MINNSSNVVPGTQLCYRALYATIVGEQPPDCLPGTSVKMSENGPILVDHVMRAARQYIPSESRRGFTNNHNNNNNNNNNNRNNRNMAVDSSGTVEELWTAVGDLRRQNRQFQRDLETRTQQLELRKQEVQALQNKLRVVHMEARRLGYNFHDLVDRGSNTNSNNRNGNSNGSINGNGEQLRPPLPPLRLDMNNKRGPLQSPPPQIITTTRSVSSGSTSNTSTSTTSSHSSNSTVGGGPVIAANTVNTNMNSITSIPVMGMGSMTSAVLTTTTPLPPFLQPETIQDVKSLSSNKGGGSITSLYASETVPVEIQETPQGVEDDNTKKEHEVDSSTFHSTSTNRKNGTSLPVMPQHLISLNPGAMLFCHHCRLFLAPHPVSVANHLQSEGHHSHLKTPLTSGLTYTQFGKLVQRMPSFIEAVTVVSEEERLRESSAGNHFFDSGLDIVHSTCSLCNEIVTTQSYKVHESLASHRRRIMETKEDTDTV
ncbi:hypothetical protein LSM04_001488 [Trypanosoma melophagium]|uniref:uncharacterized protein n=1 Tax=Trypanosoma melophagium TaxID=715481 RepID=UPI003519DF42|nr:hypothetical protein LSM04_001488 [Trypanosoma melophagium]